MFVTVLALEALVRGLDTVGARRSALSRHLLAAPDAYPWDRIDLAPLRQPFAEIRQASGASVFLRAGFSVSARDVPMSGELFHAGGTLEGAWESLRQNVHVWTDAFSGSFISTDACSTVAALVPNGPAPSHEFAQFSLGMMLGSVIEHVGGEALQQIWVGCDDEVLPADAVGTVDVITVPPFYALRLARAAMTVPLRTPKAAHAPLVERIAAQLTSEAAVEAPAATAYRFIATNLHRADCTIRTYSTAHLVSIRTAQRQLNACGTSFDDLVEKVRRIEVVRLLRDATLSIDDVAVALGFQSTKGFARAHLRWTGETPTAWRRRQTCAVDERSRTPRALAF